jgi:arylsulfatase A-like enzyme
MTKVAELTPNQPGGAAYYKDLPILSQQIIDYNDEWARQRLRALQSVDDMIEQLVTMLDDAGELKNTYIIFTSDNGYHLSQHRMYAGKNCGLETDINVPFIVRGPGIQRGSIVDDVSAHVDLSPTIMKLAGLKQRSEFDGAVMQFAAGAQKRTPTEHVNVEHWGRGMIEGPKGSYGGSDGRDYQNGTFKSLRLIGNGYSFYYSVWCNGEHELYDMTVSPQLCSTVF